MSKIRFSLSERLVSLNTSTSYDFYFLSTSNKGTGKTTIVQYLAAVVGIKLRMLNLSQQSGDRDVDDLLHVRGLWCMVELKPWLWHGGHCQRDSSSSDDINPILRTVVWTKAMKRLYSLVHRALEHREPVLLVGETGCGKTTAMHMIAALQHQQLHLVNCHQHSETSDFIGCLRPSRQTSHGEEDKVREEEATSSGAFFEWNDGPLVQAMRNGDVFVLVLVITTSNTTCTTFTTSTTTTITTPYYYYYLS